MFQYLILLVALVFLALGYSRVAKIFNIVDVPNNRSSHDFPIVRGGGILFYLSALFFFVSTGFQHYYLISGLSILAGLSFADDILTLKASVRMPFQFLGIFFILYSCGISFLPIWILGMISVAAVGFINIYNFMDGINGITGMYSLAVLHGFWLLNQLMGTVIDKDILGFTALSLVVFGYFNFRKKAKFFAGDVGSITIAGILLYIGIQFLTKTGSPLIFGFVAVYGIDAGFTIIKRILRKENIFKPHRQHLYQQLVDVKKISHLKVSAGYTFVQMLINVLVYFAFTLELATQYLFIIAVLIVFTTAYFAVLNWLKMEKISVETFSDTSEMIYNKN